MRAVWIKKQAAHSVFICQNFVYLLVFNTFVAEYYKYRNVEYTPSLNG